MRQKMREHLGKKDKGPLADIEFLTQYWCLQNAAAHPQIIQYSDNLRQLDALSQAHIISDTVATTLTQTYLTLRHHKHHEALKRSKVEKNPYYETLAQSVNQIWQDTFNTELSSKQ
jgi:glutamate-ammonia-ligase adenylyltransferase